MRFLLISCIMLAILITGCSKSGTVVMPTATVDFDPEKDKLTKTGNTSGGLGMKKTKPGSK